LTIFTLVVLLKDELPAFYVLVVAMTLIMLLDIIPIETALSGFANEGVLTVAVLFVVAKAVEVNRALDLFIKHVLGRPQRLWEAQLRMMIPVGFMSAFLNNTPLVAMMIPVVKTWARSNKLPVSKLMMVERFFLCVLGLICLPPRRVAAQQRRSPRRCVHHYRHIDQPDRPRPARVKPIYGFLLCF